MKTAVCATVEVDILQKVDRLVLDSKEVHQQFVDGPLPKQALEMAKKKGVKEASSWLNAQRPQMWKNRSDFLGAALEHYLAHLQQEAANAKR